MTCKHCGSERTIGYGPRIKCKDCGRSSMRIVRRTAPPPNKRPLCPDCGSPEPYSMGYLEGVRRYQCKSCGRSYCDKAKEIKEIPILEVQVE